MHETRNVPRLVGYFASDLIHGATRGDVITAKYFAPDLSLHNITGQKDAVQISHKLGHCISYPLTCDIETAQAQIPQIAANVSTILPLNIETAQAQIPQIDANVSTILPLNIETTQAQIPQIVYPP